MRISFHAVRTALPSPDVDVVTAAEQLFFVTLRITGRSRTGETWTGTGFLYGVPTSAGTASFLVTNRHVLEDARQIDFQFIRATDEGQPAYGDPHLVSMAEIDAPSWVAHPNPRVDVAAQPLGHLFAQMGTERLPFFRTIGPEHLLRQETIPELDALEDVTFIGYPSGIYDRRNLTPVARRGSTATPIAIDYEGDPAFLIDAAVFEGSSGSPVFVIGQGGYARRGGGFVVGNRLVCVGVLASGPARARIGEIIEVSTDTRNVAVLEELLSLGKVFKAWTIDETIDPLLEQHGLQRVDLESASTASPSEADQSLAEDG